MRENAYVLNILFMKGAFMSGEIPIDPEDVGVEIEKNNTETTPQEEPIDSTTTGSGNESIVLSNARCV